MTQLVLLRVVALAALGATASCAHPQAEAAPLIAVAVEPAARAESSSAYEGPATVEPLHTYRLAFEIPGRITSVTADVGDRVSAGQTLATLDARSYRAQYDVAAAQAQAAEAQAMRAQRGSRPEEVAQARDAVARAQASADLAGANERRYAQLYAEGAISAQTYDQAKQAQRDASASLDAARAQAALANEGPRSEDRTAAVAAAQAARAQAALASITISKTAIVAPADAYVQSRSIEAGSQAEPGVVSFVLTDARAPQYYASIPERIAAGVRVGDRATIVVDGARQNANVVRIEPMADPVTRTRQIRLEAPGIASAPGAVARVELGSPAQNAVSVPLGAVMHYGGDNVVAVYRSNGSTVALQHVRVVAADGDRAIVAGIAAGLPIVVAGQYQVSDGQHVRVVSKDGAQ